METTQMLPLTNPCDFWRCSAIAWTTGPQTYLVYCSSFLGKRLLSTPGICLLSESKRKVSPTCVEATVVPHGHFVGGQYIRPETQDGEPVSGCCCSHRETTGNPRKETSSSCVSSHGTSVKLARKKGAVQTSICAEHLKVRKRQSPCPGISFSPFACLSRGAVAKRY